ncbi:hypothetical protein A1O7_06816 [Cladophialophora yegresii CBS 114405]|uniref:Ubiquinol-cytochrome c chaperone domain-containing protein n=1 Tax=Cladophialophora yegresii CBS 114405 TaxID=1182544 RepID=W9VLA8_9EURO|nr:uncharacterized protein A1O7_06816 [Cladophialophora yegresii CBS 114405]EXJ56472.1 hypothetical protein A1O7_06816 [Cladophialophora yegresii CBS 114405]
MSSFNLCSYCLRALRQTAKNETNAVRAQTQNPVGQRYLSTAQRRWQQQASRSESQAQMEQPAVPPTTAATVTTNVTASPPTHNEFEDPPPQPTGQQALPTTVSTVTSNVTAPPSPPETEARSPATEEGRDRSSAQPSSSTSVSQMQRQIQSSLSSQPSKLNIPARLAQTLQRTVPAATKTYTIYGQTEALFKSCAAQADYTIPQDQRMNILTGRGPAKEASQEGAELGHPLPENKDAWWFTTLSLPPTFSTWSQITFLHLYVIVTQLRAGLDSESEFQNYHRYLIEHFSREAEDKMVMLHNLNAQGIRSRYLKDLLLQWRGILVSYDEGLVKSDAVLASAIWRNLFRADEDVDWVKVAQVVAFLRLAVRKVGSMTMDDMIRHLTSQQAGTSIWPAAQGSIATIVGKQSRGINAPFEQ